MHDFYCTFKSENKYYTARYIENIKEIIKRKTHYYFIITKKKK